MRFLKENAKGKTSIELTEAFNTRFGAHLTCVQIRSAKSRYGITSGLNTRFSKGNVPANKGIKGIHYEGCKKTQFKHGHVPKNTLPLGTEKKLANGYTYVKVNDQRNVTKKTNWVPKHRLIWEQANGPIPKGHKILFKDGNGEHVDLNNLILVSSADVAVLNKKGLLSTDATITEAGVGLARLIQATAKQRKKNKGRIAVQ